MPQSTHIGICRKGPTDMNASTIRDYADSGLTIRTAMLDHAERFPDKNARPQYILWDGLKIWTSDRIPVPKRGTVCAEFLNADKKVRQGFDFEFDDGYHTLAQGEQISLLRTWKDERYDDVVEYPFVTNDGLLWVWNVYEMTYPSGEKVVEKWTENAGFWVEKSSENERIYHCSHGMAHPPNFESLVFKVTVRP
jgi:hypothetical protein